MEEAFVMKSSNEKRDSTTNLTVEDEEIIEPSSSGRNQFYRMHSRVSQKIEKSDLEEHYPLYKLYMVTEPPQKISDFLELN